MTNTKVFFFDGIHPTPLANHQASKDNRAQAGYLALISAQLK
ncbi:hypothetical protein LDG_5492 [Legionella drancourtii LLAP12]|uniref:Uncharacterized protein n=1 Tax=Legionella drancourtii LLAP12 TaxID=658187 RepID=G9EJX3_9GAMM|nr:hypothetical protein LDG_5492 [Legionella drancourtii LLAP12]